jgi:hypothetical protein
VQPCQAIIPAVHQISGRNIEITAEFVMPVANLIAYLSV